MQHFTILQAFTFFTFTASLAATAPLAKLTEAVHFEVYKDSACTELMLPTAPTPNMTIEECFVGSYIDPSGKKQTNANGYFYCEEHTVSWTQFPGSDSCIPPASALCINATLSTDCTPVQTHMGITYQKLLNYSLPCSAKFRGPRCPSPSDPTSASSSISA